MEENATAERKEVKRQIAQLFNALAVQPSHQLMPVSNEAGEMYLDGVFPRSIGALINLTLDEAKSLLRFYDLVAEPMVRGGDERQRTINPVASFIGVRALLF